MNSRFDDSQGTLLALCRYGLNPTLKIVGLAGEERRCSVETFLELKMTLARLMVVKSAIEEVGWAIEEPRGNVYEVFDDQVVWVVRYRGGKKSLRLIFQLVDDFGNRTERLADILFFKVDGDDEEFCFHKITSDLWRDTLGRFVKKISLIAASP